MTVYQTFAPVIANEEIIPGHRVLVCHSPDIAARANPGHFLNVLASDTFNSILRKPFSIFQADTVTGYVSMLYQVSGATTLGMSRKIPGDLVDLAGPLGGRLFSRPPDEQLTHVLIGGGYGVPPLVFFAKRLRAETPDASIIFIVGARQKDLLLCELEMTELGVDVRPTTEDGSHGTRGRVTDALTPLLNSQIAVYCCGPTPMMRAVGELCIAANVPCQLSVEVSMPCGVGVCMGCVLDLTDGRRVRTCIDGPVFEAREVAWK